MSLSGERHWYRVERCHPAAVALADRHYSRQTVGAAEFMPPGKTLVLVDALGTAVWGVCENLDPAGALRWRCTIFRVERPAERPHVSDRNERERGGGVRSSDLIREATEITFRYWERQHGLPGIPLTTEVDPARVRHKRDPGRCFRRAGWRFVGVVRGLWVYEAPDAGLESKENCA